MVIEKLYEILVWSMLGQSYFYLTVTPIIYLFTVIFHFCVYLFTHLISIVIAKLHLLHCYICYICYIVTLLHCYIVTLLHCYIVTLFHCFIVTLLHCCLSSYVPPKKISAQLFNFYRSYSQFTFLVTGNW